MNIRLPHSTMDSRGVRRPFWQTQNCIRGKTSGIRDAKPFPIFREDSESDLRRLRNAYKLLGDAYDEFAQESSIHGIKNTGRHKSTLGRYVTGFDEVAIFWLLIIILSVIAAAALARKFYQRHKQATMRTLVISSQYPSRAVPFPAVTICHTTLVSAHRLKQYANEGNKLELPYGIDEPQFLKDLELIQEIYIPTNHFQNAMYRLNLVLVHNNLTMTDFLTILSPSCDDFLVRCRIQGEMKYCYHDIKVSKTPNGICCSFNYAKGLGETRWTRNEQLFSDYYGDNYIFSAILKSYGPDDRISGLTYSDGFRVLIHDSHTYPGPSARELIVREGNEMIVYLVGRVLTASPEVLELPRSERDCRSAESDDDLYRLDNCLRSCYEKLFRSYCNCVPFYASFVKDNETVCNFEHVACLSKVKARVFQTPFRKAPCNCLPTCDGTSFAVATTVAPLNAASFNPSQFYQLLKDYPNATAIHITFRRQTGILLRRDLVLSWINLVSSLGGVFSLFLGCSFISLFEMFYFTMSFIIKLINTPATNLQRT